MQRQLQLAIATAALLAGGCSSGDSWVRAIERAEIVATTTATTTTAPDLPLPPGGLSASELVAALAADELAGRDNLTQGSVRAQDLIIEQLSQFAEPALPDGYLQPFAMGSNILALIPGGDLADEYVVIGAHYDHVGSLCDSSQLADTTCNGATDNATGVAAVISIARAVAAVGTPRRSVLIALWDAEEDGLLGSAAYVAAPAVPLAATVAHLNFDIQGATLLPTLADVTFVVGAETGGEALRQATERAMATSTLQPLVLSQFLFQGRSDHANFARMGVPAILFTDATSGCYHTAQDETDIVDYAKLDQQIAAGSALLRDLVATDNGPTLETNTPDVAFNDAVLLLGLVERAETDLPLLGPNAAADMAPFADSLREIVNAGEAAFDEAARFAVMNGVDDFIGLLTRSDCQSHVTP